MWPDQKYVTVIAKHSTKEKMQECVLAEARPGRAHLSFQTASQERPTGCASFPVLPTGGLRHSPCSP